MCGTCGCADPSNRVTITDTATGDRRVLRALGNDGHSHPPTTGPSHGRAPNRHSHAVHARDAHDDRGHAHHGSHDHKHLDDHNDAHAFAHRHGIPHTHGPAGHETVSLETAILAKNDRLAARNRSWFEERGILAVNLVSSPGAGKTSVLERTIRQLSAQVEICVVEGDQMTANDADRVRAAGARAVQINTGAGCHLEADMVAEALDALQPGLESLLMIENVGNLVCPAMFDLGERMKVAIVSTTEGEDKPLKYPHMFRAAELVLVNKIDLAPFVDFDEDTVRANICEVNPAAHVLTLSAKTGVGFDAWFSFLDRAHARLRADAHGHPGGD